MHDVNCDEKRGMRGNHMVRMGIGCRPSPCRDCVGGLYMVRDPNEPEWFKLVRVLMTRALAGKSPLWTQKLVSFSRMLKFLPWTIKGSNLTRFQPFLLLKFSVFDKKLMCQNKFRVC